MTYPDSVRFLYSLGNEIKTAKLGLERITALLQALGNPHRCCRHVHVAGTNGKGSTCAMIEAGLRGAGIRTGLYTSPHLIEPVERIRISGEPVDAGEFARAFDQVHATSERLLTGGAIDMHPTYFETVTAMAFCLFRDRAVDTAVLEVGLGGRLDATNAVTPAIAVITRIDFDHEAFLGKSLAEIAGEKAGILKPGVPAVFAPQRPDVDPILDRHAAAVGAPVTRTPPATAVEIDRYVSRFQLGGLAIECPLAGEHQIENAATAATVLRALGIPPDGIRGAVWPGRLERVSADPEIILDGAHNPSGARALARYIERFYSTVPVTLIFGAMRDKAVEEIAEILFPLATTVIATAPGQQRAVLPGTIRDLAVHPDIRTAATLQDALGMLDNPRVVFITGSLFLVAEAAGLLRVKPPSP